MFPFLDIYVLTLPVAVKVFTFFLMAPYSIGNLNCFSLTKLCELVVTIAFFTSPFSIKLAPIINPSANVAHALYIPKCEILKFWRQS